MEKRSDGQKNIHYQRLISYVIIAKYLQLGVIELRG